MKPFDWSAQKNSVLKRIRGVGFEDVVNAINDNKVLDVLSHPNPKRYPNQKVYIVEIDDYAYSCPFVENKDNNFLKTIYPSRKYTKQYLRRKD
ncbi:MAG TPA: toxin [Candidatus Binatia bacterium]|nr:toxin [Candidatus Binatia bacterium]